MNIAVRHRAWILGGHVWGQELDSAIPVGPVQPGLFYDSKLGQAAAKAATHCHSDRSYQAKVGRINSFQPHSFSHSVYVHAEGGSARRGSAFSFTLPTLPSAWDPRTSPRSAGNRGSSSSSQEDTASAVSTPRFASGAGVTPLPGHKAEDSLPANPPKARAPRRRV